MKVKPNVVSNKTILFSYFLSPVFIDHQFKSSLTAQNNSLTLKSLLLIRHCCLEQIKPSYISYAHWFSNLPIRDKNEFEFFFSVLTGQVPHEIAMFLKIHINKVSRYYLCGSVNIKYLHMIFTFLILPIIRKILNSSKF
uniref:Uncharacterized protein n=1 Tax=Cacopsylla melanoneura TaxID=428564 RepID=A0A8D8Z2M6_9HEMI